MDGEDQQLVTAHPERRQYRRVKLVTEVHCESPERNEVMVTRDVSVGGMFLIEQSPLPVGCELSLTFRLHPEEPAIACRGRVVYSHAGMGMGILFLNLSAETRQALQKFVDEVA